MSSSDVGPERGTQLNPDESERVGESGGEAGNPTIQATEATAPADGRSTVPTGVKATVPTDVKEVVAAVETPPATDAKDAKDPVMTTVEDPVTAATTESVETPVKDATKAPAKDPAKAPAKDPAKDPAKETGDQAGKDGAKESRPGSRRTRYLRRVAFGILAFFGFLIAAFAIAYLFTPIPSPQEAAEAQGSVFYYADGKTVIAKQGTNRVAVPLSKVPKDVRDAVIAAENRSFYEDPGVSMKGTVRAFWSTVSGEQLQGGSTITQQMVRNYYSGLSQERTVTRKLKEIMVSLKVGREKNKDWILEQYLNTIYFGRDSYGIQAAANAYYGKDVSKLTAAEGAYLAAAIQQPSNFAEPSDDTRSYTEQRWRFVVDGMVRMGTVTAADAAKMTFPMPIKQKDTDTLKGQVGYMVNIAKQELRLRRGISEDEINRSGMKIVTTFDKRLMDAAKEAVTSNMPDGVSKKVLTGLVSVDPDTGQVLAFYGGRDYLKQQLSSSFGSYAPAASGFKPYVLAAALDDGMSLNTYVDGSSPQYFDGTRIQNDGNADYGEVNLVTATQNSVNTAYINLGQKVGLKKVEEMAEKMGIPAKQLAPHANAATLPLGVASVSPMQQAGGYATFAAEGIHRTPYVVKSITQPDGDTKKFTDKGTRVFSAQVARDATYAMSRVVTSGTGTGAQLPDGRDVAGKTGTGVEGRAIWFNGFIPQLSTSVGIFRTDNKPLSLPGYSVYGGVLPAQIWRSYVSEAVNIKNIPAKSFGDPSDYYGNDYEQEPEPSDLPTTRRPSPSVSTSPTEPHSPTPKPTKPTLKPTLPTIRPTIPRDPDNEDAAAGDGNTARIQQAGAD